MSLYTASEIVVWLLLAAALGFALGWLVHAGGARSRGSSRPAGGPPARTLPLPTGPRRTDPAPEAAPVARTAVGVPPPERETRRRTDAAVDPAAFRGSALPGPGGGAPTPQHTVKANVDAMTFHTPEMPTHRRVSADLWFKDAETARAAGFRPAAAGR